MSRCSPILYRLLLIIAAVTATVTAGYPRLSEVVDCEGPPPDLKDALEAAVRERQPFGHVWGDFQKLSPMQI